MTKILCIGFGSSGRRYLRLFNDICACTITVARRSVIADIKPELMELEKKYSFVTLDSIKDYGVFDIILVCNPSAMHWSVLKNHLDQFNDQQSIIIEKPIVTDLLEYNSLIKFIETTKSSIHIGYQYRFHPIVSSIKRLVDDGTYGYFCYGDFIHSEDVKFWHPWENYKDSYSISNELGGGASLTLSHNLDIATYILGRPTSYFHFKGNALKDEDLKTDTDDWSTYILKFERNGLQAIANIHSSYHSKIKSHTIKLHLSEATISADFEIGVLRIQNQYNSLDIHRDLKLKRDDCFKLLLLDVIKSRDNDSPYASISKFHADSRISSKILLGI